MKRQGRPLPPSRDIAQVNIGRSVWRGERNRSLSRRHPWSVLPAVLVIWGRSGRIASTIGRTLRSARVIRRDWWTITGHADGAAWPMQAA